METWDVIVVGGGPAGLMAAGRAAELGRRTLLLEKNAQPGEKLKLTGGGRCNVANAEYDIRMLLASYGTAEQFLYSPFSKFGVRDTVDFFDGRGLPLVVEERQKLFPQSQRATDVLGTLLEYMAEGGAELRTGSVVKRLLVENGAVAGVATAAGEIRAESVVLATGGLSYRQTGSTGDGFGWLRALGHTIHAPNPDLVPLKVREQWVKDLSGTALPEIGIAFEGGGKRLARTGRLLFTHFGLSGPMVLNVSHEVKKLLASGPVAAFIDLFPTEDAARLDRRLIEAFDANKNKTLRNVLKLLAPVGVARGVAAQLDDELLNCKINIVTQEERRRLVGLLKALPLTVTGTMGYDWAIVSDGGVPLEEIDTRRMASRRYPNLFVVGDLLHISRPSGGFSLQLCWTTGWVAGDNA